MSFASCTFSDEKGKPDVDAEADHGGHESEYDSSVVRHADVVTPFRSIVSREHYHVIEIKQMKFHPAELTVGKGDTVVWVNKGIAVHDVTEQPAGEWTSSTIAVGGSWQMIVTKRADYYCSLHVVMKGKVLLRD